MTGNTFDLETSLQSTFLTIKCFHWYTEALHYIALKKL